MAQRLATSLANHPYDGRNGVIKSLTIFTPTRLARSSCQTFTKLEADFKIHYPNFNGHIFIGATGIAVRALSHVIQDKFHDLPVVVIDSLGQFAIALLAGHWGGANALTRHLAKIIQATPVITTASEHIYPDYLSLDLTIQKYDLSILDPEYLPLIQGLILEGEKIDLYDPENIYPESPYLTKVDQIVLNTDNKPFISLGFKNVQPAKNHLRLIAQRLIAGIGLHRGLEQKFFLSSILKALDRYAINKHAIKAIASIDRLKDEPALSALAKYFNCPCHFFSAETLAEISVPNPSVQAGRAFNQQPFSVAEASAILAAKLYFTDCKLLYPKIKIDGQITFALAKGRIKIKN
ncbi:MAG: cobalamin biosynthesis protein [Desulfovibrionaceae bacterium]|nr:cobalamin biosynthesis protein [Desulfovibrionaceae bacterium]